jgi:hypothetical protein
MADSLVDMLGGYLDENNRELLDAPIKYWWLRPGRAGSAVPGRRTLFSWKMLQAFVFFIANVFYQVSYWTQSYALLSNITGLIGGLLFVLYPFCSYFEILQDEEIAARQRSKRHHHVSGALTEPLLNNSNDDVPAPIA